MELRQNLHFLVDYLASVTAWGRLIYESFDTESQNKINELHQREICEINA